MKRKHKILILIFAIILFIWISITVTDYILVKNDKEPLFAKYTDMSQGGSKYYSGLAYKIIKYHELDDIKRECVEKEINPLNEPNCLILGRKDTVFVMFNFWELKVK